MARHPATVLNEVLQTASSRRALLSDRELLQRFVDAGDEAAFAFLFRRHSSMVLGVCRRALTNLQDAEDACQATFLVLARRAKSTHWQASVANWLYTAARRVSGNARLAAARRRKRELHAAVPEAVQPVDQMTGRELLQIVDAELDKLSPVHREALVLCYLEGLTRDEAAARLGVPVTTLKTRLERGRKRLGQALTRRGCAAGAGLVLLAATSSKAVSTHSPLVALSSAGQPPASVAALAECFASRGIGAGKLSALVLFTSLAALGIGLSIGQPSTSGAGPQEAMPAKGDRLVATAGVGQNPTKQLDLTGRVLGVDGKPSAGAGCSWSERAIG